MEKGLYTRSFSNYTGYKEFISANPYITIVNMIEFNQQLIVTFSY